MKLALLAAFLTLPLAAQTPKPEKTPSLSISQRIALQDLEQQKQQAAQAYQRAEAQESAISQEFSQEHPGWKLDAKFQPEKSLPKK